MIPRLLICEGPEDRWFFSKLIEARNLSRFHIRAAGGNRQFAAEISKFELEQTKEYINLTDILIVADNDDAPAESFASVCDQINAKFGPGSAPDEPLKPTKGRPRCTILMIPWTATEGTLESLCVDATRNADKAVGSHVDHFLALLAAEKWTSVSRRGKAWLRTDLAGRCEVDPFVPLGRVFSEKRHEDLIPLLDASFTRLANALAGIG